MAKMTQKKWEGSKADKAMDGKKGYKEGSKKDNAADRRAVAKINKKRK
ncbi:MAG: hypothetical protein KGL39_37890 [Patescibacteria group bacterium]|nr:hypothetical protein [Patescibacteria group bacterium]